MQLALVFIAKMSQDLNLGISIKFLEENINKTFFDINHNKNFLTQYIELFKSFCTAKETINKTKKKTPRIKENISKCSI